MERRRATNTKETAEMAYPTPVNGQITDAVTQANVKVLGDAPAMAMGAIYQSLAHSTGILYENATSSQQQLAIAAQAATNQGVIQIYSVDTMAGAVAAAKIGGSDVPDNMLALLTALRASTGPIPS
jgi:RecA/RadA recombinase